MNGSTRSASGSPDGQDGLEPPNGRVDGSGWVAEWLPRRVRSAVYVVGMLGFPIAVASFFLLVLSNDLKSLDKAVTSLAGRIDERPMGLEKTTDFITYVTDALRSELRAGIPEVISGCPMACRPNSREVAICINRTQRMIEQYVRPIVRRHVRFSERFPTAGGNLGSYFLLSAPAEDKKEGDSEAYLAGSSTKDFGEALSALIANTIVHYGNPDMAKYLSAKGLDQDDVLLRFLGLADSRRREQGLLSDVPPVPAGEAKSESSQSESPIMDKELFVELALGSIDVAITALKDQMLIRARQQVSDTGMSK